MNRIKSHRGKALALLCIGLFACGPLLADKPALAGGGHADKHGRDRGTSGNDSYNRSSDKKADHSGGDNDRYGDRDPHEGDHNDNDNSRSGIYFGEDRRSSIRDYYSHEIRSGHCPPGLAKKHNGCMPPGHARKWAIGQQLPRDVIFYDLPPPILGYLGAPPPRHRYVRVASDILLITIGTGMVVDAIQDLGRI